MRSLFDSKDAEEAFLTSVVVVCAIALFYIEKAGGPSSPIPSPTKDDPLSIGHDHVISLHLAKQVREMLNA